MCILSGTQLRVLPSTCERCACGTIKNSIRAAPQKLTTNVLIKSNYDGGVWRTNDYEGVLEPANERELRVAVGVAPLFSIVHLIVWPL